jgi:hypothetical protein
MPAQGPSRVGCQVSLDGPANLAKFSEKQNHLSVVAAKSHFDVF